MKIYITDLEAYNNGHLVGNWYTLPMSLDLLAESIEDVLREGRRACNSDHFHEEYFITDSDCAEFHITEYSDIFELNRKAEILDTLSDYDKKSLIFLLDEGLVNDFDEGVEKISDVVVYENMTMEDVASDYVSECYDLDSMPSIISNNIDYEKIGRELEMDGRYFVRDGDIYEFSG